MSFFIALMVCMFIFTSCEEKDQNMVIDTNIIISYIDNQNHDLLNPSHDHYIDSKEIKLYIVSEGEKELVNNSNLDYPAGFRVYFDKTIKRNVLEIFPSQFSDSSGEFEIIVMLDDLAEDSLKYEIKKTDNVEKVVKVWYNNILKWTEKDGERSIVVTKEV